MRFSFRVEPLTNIDDHQPARRRPSAFRRYRELMPREVRPYGATSSGTVGATASESPPSRTEHHAGHPTTDRTDPR